MTSQTEILGDHPQEEGGHHHAPQDHLQEEVGAEEVEAEEVVEEEEAAEEHSHRQDTRLPRQLKNF